MNAHISEVASHNPEAAEEQAEFAELTNRLHELGLTGAIGEFEVTGVQDLHDQFFDGAVYKQDVRVIQTSLDVDVLTYWELGSLSSRPANHDHQDSTEAFGSLKRGGELFGLSGLLVSKYSRRTTEHLSDEWRGDTFDHETFLAATSAQGFNKAMERIGLEPGVDCMGMVEVDADVVPPMDYVAMATEGVMPASRHTPLMAEHDLALTDHVQSWWAMPKDVLDHIKVVATRALESGNPEDVDRVAEGLDGWVNATYNNAQFLHGLLFDAEHQLDVSRVELFKEYIDNLTINFQPEYSVRESVRNNKVLAQAPPTDHIKHMGLSLSRLELIEHNPDDIKRLLRDSRFKEVLPGFEKAITDVCGSVAVTQMRRMIDASEVTGEASPELVAQNRQLLAEAEVYMADRFAA